MSVFKIALFHERAIKSHFFTKGLISLRTDPRLSKLILKYTQNTDQALSDQALELFGRESTKSMSDTIEYTKCERVQKVKRAMTKRWIEYHVTTSK